MSRKRNDEYETRIEKRFSKRETRNVIVLHVNGLKIVFHQVDNVLNCNKQIYHLTTI